MQLVRNWVTLSATLPEGCNRHLALVSWAILHAYCTAPSGVVGGGGGTASARRLHRSAQPFMISSRLGAVLGAQPGRIRDEDVDGRPPKEGVQGRLNPSRIGKADT